MRWGLAASAIGQTSQSDAIHSPEAWASGGQIVLWQAPGILLTASERAPLPLCPTPSRSRTAFIEPAGTRTEGGVGIVTVHQLEAGTSAPRRATFEVIRRAFERAGVEFISENGG